MNETTQTPAPTPEHHEPWFRLSVPYATPLVLACLYIAAVAQLPTAWLNWQRPLLYALAVLVVAVAVAATLYLDRTPRRAVPPASLALGTLGFLLLVETDLARYTLIAASCVLVGAYLSHVEKCQASGAVEAEHEERLVLVLLAPAAFFLLSFAFALTGKPSIPAWQVGLPMAAFIAFVTAELAGKRLPTGQPAWLLPTAAAVIGYEFFQALSLLPLIPLVNGAVAAILLSLFGHKMRDELVPGEDRLAHRRFTAMSLLLIVIILVTAQWL